MAIPETVSAATNASTPQTLMSLRSCVISTLRMCETSGVSVRCPFPSRLSAIIRVIPGSMSRVHLRECRFKLRIVNRNEWSLAQLPRKHRQPQPTKSNQRNHVHPDPSMTFVRRYEHPHEINRAHHNYQR